MRRAAAILVLLIALVAWSLPLAAATTPVVRPVAPTPTLTVPTDSNATHSTPPAQDDHAFVDEFLGQHDEEALPAEPEPAAPPADHTQVQLQTETAPR